VSRPSAFPPLNPVQNRLTFSHKVPPPEDAVLLRIFTGDNHRYQHLPLFEAIVLKARELHLAGATVLHGILGFGKSSRIHQGNHLNLSSDLPVVIEIVDSAAKIDSFLLVLEQMMPSGLITLERARIIA
jgi:PII-like signaling protein